MQIVIDISEKLYDKILSDVTMTIEESSVIAKRIYSGTPLPKWHGRLKDFEKLYTDMIESEKLARQRVIDSPTSPCYMRYVAQLNERTAFKEMLFDAPTIIEADNGGE